jgi:protein TonB
MSTGDLNHQEEEPGFLRRNGIAIGVGVIIAFIALGVVSVFLFSGKVSPPHKPEEIVIHLQPPPPLPPPPPPPPQPKMVEQPPVLKPEEKPKDEPKAPDKPPGPPTPAAGGPPSDFGIGGTGGGGGNGLGGGGGGSRWGWYAGEVQARIAEALRKNDKTKDAKLRLKVRIWSDSSGRVTRAELGGSTGDPSIDSTLKNDILVGLQLQEPPPADMPMPIVLRLTELRTN